MEKKILTAMLSFAFLFLMAVNVSGQNLNDDVNTYGVASKADATYLENLPNFVDAEVAKDLLKTQIKANMSTFTANEGTANGNTAQAEINLYNEVFRLIYREELSVQDAIVTAFGSTAMTGLDASGNANQYSNNGMLQNLVNLLAN